LEPLFLKVYLHEAINILLILTLESSNLQTGSAQILVLCFCIIYLLNQALRNIVFKSFLRNSPIRRLQIYRVTCHLSSQISIWKAVAIIFHTLIFDTFLSACMIGHACIVAFVRCQVTYIMIFTSMHTRKD